MRRVHCIGLAAALVLCCVVTGCTEDPTGPPPIVIPDSTEAILYSKHIQPIFANGCAGSGCHMNHDNIQSLYLDSWENVMAGTPEYGAEVVPYNAAKSHLFQHINVDTLIAPISTPAMPLGRFSLPKEQIMTIKRWIDEGARNDAGQVYLADQSRPRLFVTAQTDDLISVIDLASEHLMRYIPVGTLQGGAPEAPHNAVLSPDKRFLYVNLIVGGVVEKYDARTFEKLGSVRVGLSPAQIVCTHDGSRFYVSNFDRTGQQRFILRVDAAQMRVTDTLFDVGAAPHGLTLSADEQFIYTMNPNGDDISEVNTQTLEVTRRINISPGQPLAPGEKPRFEPYQAELSADGKQLWVTCRAASQVRVVDLASGAVIDSIIVGKTPLILGMTPDRRQAWIPNQGDNSVSVIDVATHSVIATLADFKTQPHGVIFSADGKKAFVSCENQTGGEHHPTIGSPHNPGQVYVVDVATRQITRQIEVGAFAAGMAIGG